MSNHKKGMLVVIVLALGAVAHAQTAGMLSFQGLLKDAGGVPVNGPVTLQFRIYDAQTGGALVDMDGNGLVEDVVGKDAKEVSTTATKGIVSTKFGPVSPKAFNGQPRWLEMRVNGTALSRTEMATAAATAEQVNKPASGSSAVSVSANGNLGVGISDPVSMLHIFSGSDPTLILQSDGMDEPSGRLSLRQSNGVGYDIYYDGGPDQLVFETFDSGHVAGAKRLVLNHQGYIGVHTTNPQETLDVRGPVSWGGAASSLLNDDQGGSIELGSRESSLPNPWPGGKPYIDFHYGHGRSEDYNVRLINESDSRLTVKAQVLQVDGRVRSSTVEITGGSDLAEPFAVAKSKDTPEKIEPGMVVVIDPENPGQLKLAREPYDRKVAGVISGANGLQPGMVMTAAGSPATPPAGDSVSSSDRPVALTGRVYVWADASYGPIEPGDLLTTSATPGHAMRADEKRDFPRGCIIGKAMSKLEKGKGLVLVLVQPQ